MIKPLLFTAVILGSASVWGEGLATDASSVPTSKEATVFVRPFCRMGMQFLAASLSKVGTSTGAGDCPLSKF
ncbi:MAG: hypothetical protein Q7U16_10115 [Agitococcus sp.]|nr:hypothetical protein [Agitococcus sp.]